jgi:hypothetical protein
VRVPTIAPSVSRAPTRVPTRTPTVSTAAVTPKRALGEVEETSAIEVQVSSMPMKYLFVGAVALTLLVTMGAAAFLFASCKNKSVDEVEQLSELPDETQGAMI